MADEESPFDRWVRERHDIRRAYIEAVGQRFSVFEGWRSPHADDLVLHRPGICVRCDRFGPRAQSARIQFGINFSNEHDPTKSPDPAQLSRPDTEFPPSLIPI